MGLCLYVPIHPINVPLPPVHPSYQCICTGLLVCFFPSVNSPLLSMIPYKNASFCWKFIILILIARIFGILFCLLLGPSVLLMHPFRMLCQCYLSVNASFCQYFILLIDWYINNPRFYVIFTEFWSYEDGTKVTKKPKESNRQIFNLCLFYTQSESSNKLENWYV